MHIINSTIELRIWPVSLLSSTLGNCCCWFRVIHVAFCPNLWIEILDPVLIQTNISNVLPKSIYIPSCVESCQISRSFSRLLTRLLHCIWVVGFIHSLAATKNGTVLMLHSFSLLILYIFRCRSKGIRCFESRRWLHESGCIGALHFNLSRRSHTRLDSVLRTVKIRHNLVSTHVFLASLLLHRSRLAEGSDLSAYFWWCEPVSWVLLAYCRFYTMVVVTLTGRHCCPWSLSKAKGRGRSLAIEIKRALGRSTSLWELSSSCSSGSWFTVCRSWRCLRNPSKHIRTNYLFII